MINHSNRPYGFFGFDKITNTFKIICIEDCLEGEEVKKLKKKNKKF